MSITRINVHPVPDSGNGFHIEGYAGWYSTRAEVERELRWLLASGRWSGIYPRIVPAERLATRTKRMR